MDDREQRHHRVCVVCRGITNLPGPKISGWWKCANLACGAANLACGAEHDGDVHKPTISKVDHPKVDHPNHYGGADNTYEAIKVIDAWGLGFCLGNTLKYIARAGRKNGESVLDDLKKARWYLDYHIARLESRGG